MSTPYTLEDVNWGEHWSPDASRIRATVEALEQARAEVARWERAGREDAPRTKLKETQALNAELVAALEDAVAHAEAEADDYEELHNERPQARWVSRARAVLAKAKGTP